VAVGHGLGLDAWWDEPAYKAAKETFTQRGIVTLAKLEALDAAKLEDVLADVYRDVVPDSADMTKFEWEVILRFLGAHPQRHQGRAAMDGARDVLG
jgi:hypothetical protein